MPGGYEPTRDIHVSTRASIHEAVAVAAAPTTASAASSTAAASSATTSSAAPAAASSSSAATTTSSATSAISSSAAATTATAAAGILSSGSAGVHTGTAPGVHTATAPTPRALKIFRANQPRGPRRLALLQAWLAAVDAQTAARARRPDRWAPIHTAGLCPDGAYAVTDLYSRSFQRIIDGRLTVDPPTLHAIARAIIEGLLALEQAAARPHGALKPSNIFVPGTAILRKSPILLSEPAPLAGITREQARAADFRALGTLLVTLVRKRARAGWPIGDSPEWHALGKHARDWIDFCNYLIDPHAKPADFTLDELQRRFARLGGRALPLPLKAALVAAPLLILASPLAWLRFTPFEKLPASVQEIAIKLGNLPPDVEEVPPEFGELCTAWFEWFGSLCAELDEPRVRTRWNTDPWLREHVTPIADTRARLDPRLITDAGPNFESLTALRDAPPESAKRGLVVRQIKQARATLATLATALENWPGEKRLADAAARFQSRGWPAAALELRPPPPPPATTRPAPDRTQRKGRWPADKPPPPPPAAIPLASDIDARLILLENAAAAEYAWTAVTTAATTLAATGDPVLSGLSDMVRLRVAQTPLAELPARLAAQQPLLDARLAFVRGDWAARIDHARWLRESFVRDFTGPVTDETLARWDADIRPYYLVDAADDPRAKVDWDAADARLASTLRNLTGEEIRLGLGPAASTPLAAEISAFSIDLEALLTRQVLRKDIPAVTDETAALQTRLDNLAARLAAALDDMRPAPAEWLARVRADAIAASPVLQSEWTRRRDQLLDGVTPQTLADDDAAFRALRVRLRRVREFLDALDGPQLAGAIAPMNLDGIPDAIAAQTLAADAAQKEAAFTEFLARSQWSPDGAPALPIADFARLPANQTRLAALAATRSAAAALAASLARLETLLDLGATWSAPIALAASPAAATADATATTTATATGTGTLSSGSAGVHTGTASGVHTGTASSVHTAAVAPASIQKIITDAAASPAFASVTAAGRPAELAAAARQLESLQTETDRATLITLAATATLATTTAATTATTTTTATPPPLSLPLAAWNRLDALPDWPANLDELDREIALESALKTRIETTPAFAAAGLPEIQKTHLAALAAAARHRWRRAYAQIDPARTPEILQRMTPMGMTPDDLAALDRFDYLLAGAKTARWPRLTEQEAKTRRDAFISQARAIPETAADTALARFLDDTAAINLEPTGETVTPADVGPGRIGWQGEFTEDSRRATYRWTDLTGATRLQEYLLVEPETGVPFFLSTRAISIGDFIALIEQHPAGAEVIAAMPPYLAAVSGGTDIDARPGPQTWRILAPRHASARRLRDSRMTLNTRWTAYLDPRWPEPLYAPDLAAPPAPTAAHPLQNIPPAAARAFAERVLGARLPAPEEWTSLATLYADRASPAHPGANFSDAAWLAQRDYLIQRGANFEYPWPDSGAFVPLDYAGGARQTARPYAPDTDDRTLWFAETGAPGGDFIHLYGNVATYLHDPQTDRYSVAGGSALSPEGLDPKLPSPIDAYAEGYADVGLRPAFDASKAMLIRASLIKLLRQQPYTRQQPQK
jgi:hypothetical protein